jgi:aryl-alcohol dehydrogenase-like predicted oxidoreductase
VGLYAPDGSHANIAAVWTRKAMGKVFPPLSRPVVDWSIMTARKSLESSLRQLAVDQIDLLLLHEPIAGAIESDAFLEWLQAEQRQGRIRAWGLAGEVDRMHHWLAPSHPLGMVLQVRDSLDRREADLVMARGRDLQISYGYLSSRVALPTQLTVTDTLTRAMRRNATGSVLVSTHRLDHLGELAALAEQDDDNNR